MEYIRGFNEVDDSKSLGSQNTAKYNYYRKLANIIHVLCGENA